MIIIKSNVKVLGGFQNTNTLVEICQQSHVKADKQLYLNAKFYKSKEDFLNKESEIDVLGVEKSKYFPGIEKETLDKPIYEICDELYEDYLVSLGFQTEIIPDIS